MNDPRRVRVSGPLSGCRDGFAEELARQGYTAGSAQRQVLLLAHLSRWLDSCGFRAADLTPGRVEEFLGARRAEGYALEVSQRGVLPLLGYLRGLGMAPVWPEPVPGTPAEMLLEEYGSYLAAERGLAAASIERYLSTARLFLSEFGRPEGPGLAGLTAGDVTAFVVRQCRARCTGSAKALVTALRSLLRFLFLEGWTPCPLAQAVPAATGWADQRLPRPLSAEAVPALLASCDRDTLAGARDFAILTMLHRLGLRAGEVAALQLGSIDWRRGEIVVQGKGGSQERLPVPADVGGAVVAYLRQRPKVECRALFLRVRAPVAGLTSDGVQDVVRGSCRRAGLPAAGAHRLRHHAATTSFNAGVDISVIVLWLGHERPETTSRIYLHADMSIKERALARTTPLGAKPGRYQPSDQLLTFLDSL